MLRTLPPMEQVGIREKEPERFTPFWKAPLFTCSMSIEDADKKSFIRMFFWGFGGRFWLILPTMGWSNRYLTNHYTQLYQGHIL